VLSSSFRLIKLHFKSFTIKFPIDSCLLKEKIKNIATIFCSKFLLTTRIQMRCRFVASCNSVFTNCDNYQELIDYHAGCINYFWELWNRAHVRREIAVICVFVWPTGKKSRAESCDPARGKIFLWNRRTILRAKWVKWCGEIVIWILYPFNNADDESCKIST
jgi:hypothetical protein